MLKRSLYATFAVLLALTLSMTVFSQKRSIKSLDDQAVSPGNSQALSPNEELVVQTMKEIYKVQARYYWANGGIFAHLKSLLRERLIDKQLGSGQKYGYDFYAMHVAASTTSPAKMILTAHPSLYRQGYRSFYMTSDCFIRGADKRGADANENDPVIGECTPTIALEWDRYIALSMRNMVAAQYTYNATSGNGQFGTHDQLIAADMFTRPFWAGDSRAFHQNWTVMTTPGDINQAASFKARSEPRAYRHMGVSSFYSDETGVVRGADHQGGPAGPTDSAFDFSPSADTAVNERMAMQMIWTVYATQRTFVTSTSANYASFDQLRHLNLLWIPFEIDRFQGYVYTMTLTPRNGNVAPKYALSLVPAQYGVTGVRSFYTDESGYIRGGDKHGAPATADDPQINPYVFPAGF